MADGGGAPTVDLQFTSNRVRQNGVVQPLLTDLYQITMAYAYWKSGKYNDHAVFDLFFRKNPFQGEFTIFAGLEECLKFLNNFHYSESDISYLQQTLPTVEPAFLKFLSTLTAKDVRLYAIDEGSVVFPRVPLMRVEGPLPIVQLLETTLLTLVNYASLVATNAARYRTVAGPNIKLLEFGLRRAQGPDGGLSASKYTYMGGFDGTSNVLAGKLFNIPVRGTHAHAFVTSFLSLEELTVRNLCHKDDANQEVDFLALTLEWRKRLSGILHVLPDQANEGELAAFVSYAIAFPDGFLALIDTYDVIRSGMLNFCSVAMALNDLGYHAVGVRLDSGDLAYLSNMARESFRKIGLHFNVPWFENMTVVASNDINEETIISLNEQGHKIDCFGIGTHLVTCQRQPALGCVYKLVEVNDQPRIKLSQDVEKVTMPGRKDVYRLYGQDGHALLDLLQRTCEPPPEVGQRVLCRHPFQESKRAYVKPVKVEKLYKLYWSDGQIMQQLPSLEELRRRVQDALKALRNDHRRSLNPTPYKCTPNWDPTAYLLPVCTQFLEEVSVTDALYTFIHDLWLQNAPIGELS